MSVTTESPVYVHALVRRDDAPPRVYVTFGPFPDAATARRWAEGRARIVSFVISEVRP